MNTRPIKHVEALRGGNIEVLTYDEAEIQFWRITFTAGQRKATIRLQIPHETLRRRMLLNLIALAQQNGSLLSLIMRLYQMALEGGLPIVLDGFDEPPNCDKNV